MVEQWKDVKLSDLDGGVVEEKFQCELEKVLSNIMDENTDPDKLREINIKMRIKPTKARDMATVQIDATSKLAPTQPVQTTIHLVSGKKPKAVQLAARQAGLFQEGEQKPSLRVVGEEK